MISFKHIEDSYNRIKNYVNLTPILESQKLNEITNSRILIKAECLQKTGSFKIRGAMNMISQIKNNNTVVAPSSGNHAQGVASAANYLNFSSTLVMPRDAPKTKINGVKSYGGKIHFYDRHNEDRFKIAQKIARKDKSILIPPYDHPDIIAGQGTIGFEIINQLSETNFIPDTIFCCCGGGGLIAGLALSINHKWPKTKIHPVEPLGWDDTKTSLQKGVRVKATKKHSSKKRRKILWTKSFSVIFPEALENHIVQRNLSALKSLDLKVFNEDLTLDPVPLKKEYKALSDSFPFLNQDNGYCLIHPTSRREKKLWDKEKFGELINLLAKQNLSVVITSGPDLNEVDYVEEILEKANVLDQQVLNLAGKTSLLGLAALIKGAKFFIGLDSVASHIAASVNKESITLFGPSNPINWKPWSDRAKIIVRDDLMNIEVGEVISLVEEIYPQS